MVGRLVEETKLIKIKKRTSHNYILETNLDLVSVQSKEKYRRNGSEF